MHKLSMNRIIQVGAVLFFVLSVALVAWLVAGSKSDRRAFGSGPAGVTLQCLGSPTNYLKQMELMDPSRRWKVFSISNGTSRAFMFSATAVDYRTATGWVSNHWAAAGLMTRRETPGGMWPGRSYVFYASIPTSSVPWRLRLACREAGRMDELVSKIQGLSPTNTGRTGWSGKSYELISSEIAP
jgi:hypothetical protein